jgi:uridylate kinase
MGIKGSGACMDTVVISIGGSVLVPSENDVEYMKSLAQLLKKISETHKLFMVTGGGRIARYYITFGRGLGAEEYFLDEVGIDVTRLNAKLLIKALGEYAHQKPAMDINEAITAGNNHNIVVMGGTEPGHTTDAVSAMLAEKLKAVRLVNATTVDGVYDSDPKLNPDAKKFDKMSYEQLITITSKTKHRAKPTVIFDPKGAKLIADAKIPLMVCNGRDLDDLEKAILGEEFSGTTVN